MSIENDSLIYGKMNQNQTDFLDKVIELGVGFIEGSVREGKVINYENNDKLREIFNEDLPEYGMSLEELFGELRDKVAFYSISQSDPRYLAFPDSGNSVATIAADILTAFLNQNLIAIDRSAPAGTFVEAALIQWLRALVGYSYLAIDSPDFDLSKVGGLWTSGGNMSNHIAILVALHNRLPQLKSRGLCSLNKRPVIILSSDIEHFSFSSAALSLGLGSDNIVRVPSTSGFTTDLTALRQTLNSLPGDCEPIMVVCVAGNCRTTSIDSIPEMRAICDDYGIWLHVDACHGGSLLFSSDLRKNLAEIEKADSVSLDPHKGLFVTYSSSYVLFRNPESLGFICRYPEKFEDSDCLDLGLIMPFYGSRGFSSLKLWMLIKHLGVEGLAKLVEMRQSLNQELASCLHKCEWFVLLNGNDFYRTAFLFCPGSIHVKIKTGFSTDVLDNKRRKLIDKYTALFSEQLYQSGDLVFDSFSLRDLGNHVGLGEQHKYKAIAMAVGHPYMEQEIKSHIFQVIDDFAKPLSQEMEEEFILLDDTREIEEKSSSEGPASW